MASATTGRKSDEETFLVAESMDMQWAYRAYGKVDAMTIYREARASDEEFIVEMARHASAKGVWGFDEPDTLENHPIPDADVPVVQAVLPPCVETAVVATDETGRRLGAAWWHWHEPPLLADSSGEPLPEMLIAVAEDARGTGVGARLIEALADKASRRFTALALNVHLRNPAGRLYTRTGFRVAGRGRGWFGVAMKRDLHPQPRLSC